MSTSQRDSLSRRKTTRSDNIFSNAFNNNTRATVAPKESTSNRSVTKTGASLASIQPTFQMSGSTAVAAKTTPLVPQSLNPPPPSTSVSTKQKSPTSPKSPRSPKSLLAPMIFLGQPTSKAPASQAPPSQAPPSQAPATQAPTLVMMKKAPEQVEHPVELSMRAGLKVELAFSLAALASFLGLVVFMWTANCYNRHMDDIRFWVQMFGIVGAVTSAFVTLYCFFENHLSPREGLTSCLFFTTLVAVACLNSVGAYLSIGCVCRCDSYAFGKDQDSADLKIFIFEVAGSAFLLIIVLVASITQHVT